MSKVLRPLSEPVEPAGAPQPKVRTVRKVIATGYVPKEETVQESKLLNVPKKDNTLIGGFTQIGSLAKDEKQAGRYSKAAEEALAKAAEKERQLKMMKNPMGGFVSGDSSNDSASYAFAGLEDLEP